MINLRRCMMLALLAAVAGCSRPPKVAVDQPQLPQAGFWEKAWVEPRIVHTDSLLTLIRADWVDSFYVEETAQSPNSLVPSFSFSVDQDFCSSEISVVNAAGNLVLPLIRQRLRRGFYKATVNANRSDLLRATAGILFVRVEYCGMSIVEQLSDLR